MELAATITGYLVIGAISVFTITMGVYWTVHRLIDAWGVRDQFLQMRKQRDEAWATIRKLETSES